MAPFTYGTSNAIPTFSTNKGANVFISIIVGVLGIVIVAVIGATVEVALKNRVRKAQARAATLDREILEAVTRLEVVGQQPVRQQPIRQLPMAYFPRPNVELETTLSQCSTLAD